LSFEDEGAQDWHQETFSLAGTGPRCDNEVFTLREEGLKGGRLVRIGWLKYADSRVFQIRKFGQKIANRFRNVELRVGYTSLIDRCCFDEGALCDAARLLKQLMPFADKRLVPDMVLSLNIRPESPVKFVPNPPNAVVVANGRFCHGDFPNAKCFETF
jgi:hypothetical protein